jgi:hypothetical protein
MKTVDEINAEWMSGEVPAFVAIGELLEHFAREGVDPVVARIDPSLSSQVLGFARDQRFDELIPAIERDGEDPTPYIALRDWLARGEVR